MPTDDEIIASFTPKKSASSSVDLQSFADSVAKKYGVDPKLFRKLIHQESGWNPKAVSPVGAQGLGQLMPATARQLGVTDPFDPMQNLDASARYLSQQIKGYGGDV